jgi:hypothetical protein
VADAISAYLLEALDVDTSVWSKFNDAVAADHTATLTHKD